METAVIYFSAAGFFLSIFPVHVFSYVFITTHKNTAEFNVSLYKIVPIVKLSAELCDIKNLLKNTDDGKNKKKLKLPDSLSLLEIYNKLCITKIVQLSDFGMRSENYAYLALGQNFFTDILYSFVRCNAGKTKLKNFSILNCEHGEMNYYLKVVGVINMLTLTKLLTMYLWSKINES